MFHYRRLIIIVPLSSCSTGFSQSRAASEQVNQQLRLCVTQWSCYPVSFMAGDSTAGKVVNPIMNKLIISPYKYIYIYTYIYPPYHRKYLVHKSAKLKGFCFMRHFRPIRIRLLVVAPRVIRASTRQRSCDDAEETRWD